MQDNQLLAYYEPRTPESIIEEAISKYNVGKFYCLFSGGKDSVCVADYVARNYPDYFGGVVFTVTGIGSKATEEFVKYYTDKRSWQLYKTYPKETETYEAWVLKYGFPGPANHHRIMGALKFHTWQRFVSLMKFENPILISGVRKKESWARSKKRIYSKKPIDKSSNITFAKPFIYKNASQLWEYYKEYDLEKSPVYDWFNKSGECHCGSFAQRGELDFLNTYDKEIFNKIKTLENKIDLIGTKTAKKYNRWGHSISTDDIKAQNKLDEYCGESCVV